MMNNRHTTIGSGGGRRHLQSKSGALSRRVLISGDLGRVPVIGQGWDRFEMAQVGSHSVDAFVRFASRTPAILADWYRLKFLQVFSANIHV